jgi:hypothetical protein
MKIIRDKNINTCENELITLITFHCYLIVNTFDLVHKAQHRLHKKLCPNVINNIANVGRRELIIRQHLLTHVLHVMQDL